MFNKNLNSFLKNKIKQELKLKKKRKQRIIFHIDVNNAFLSWTALKLISEGKKDIRLTASVISGSPRERQGVIVSKSEVAKKFGIKSGEPLFLAIKKCPELEIYSPDHEYYKKMNKKLNDIFKKYTLFVEPYSIDESFLDMTDFLFGNSPINLAKQIQNDIFSSLGFTVNIGIANSKILAKTASDFSKPNKIHTLFDYEIPKKLWTKDITTLFMLGKKTAEKLRKIKINTIYDIAKSEPVILYTLLGKNGLEIYKHSYGIDNSIVQHIPRQRKSISHEHTFSYDQDNKEFILSTLMQLTDKVAIQLRKENLKTNTVGIHIRSDDFKNYGKTQKLSSPTNLTEDIFNMGKKLLEEIYFQKKPKYKIRLIGISAENVEKQENKTFTLFDLLDKNNPIYLKQNKDKKIQKTIDEINLHHGKNSIKRASSLIVDIKEKKDDN